MRKVSQNASVGLPSEQDIKKDFWLLNDTAESAALAMRDTFSDVLKPMFDTGFLLFDKFMGYMTQRLLQFAADQAFNSIFGWLVSMASPAGAVGAVGGMFTGISPSGSANQTPVTIQMDGKKVGSGLIPQYGNIRQDAARLRYI